MGHYNQRDKKTGSLRNQPDSKESRKTKDGGNGPDARSIGASVEKV